MLVSLQVRDLLLIEHIQIDFCHSYTVLTGETGAGKSILLDALGLVLGERGSVTLVRTGAAQASVTAIFKPTESIKALLKEQALPVEETLVLRRVLTSDGRSKAFINDEAVSLNLMKSVGAAMVEVHGQFDHWLDPTTHRQALDRYGNLEPDLIALSQSYSLWKEAVAAHNQAKKDISALQANHRFLKTAVEDLEQLAPEDGEEDRLVEERTVLAQKTKIMEAIRKVLELIREEKGIEANNNTAFRLLDRVRESGIDQHISPILECFDRIGHELHEARALLESLEQDIGGNPHRLEEIEERLADLRGMARKYNCAVVALPQLALTYREDLDQLSLSDDKLKKLQTSLHQKEQGYLDKAKKISMKRQDIARHLEKALQRELRPLKLESAQIFVDVTPFPEGRNEHYSSSGIDCVEFQVQTNLGTPKGPLRKIASGGERSRFMLALKVVMAGGDHIPTLIFDEIDSGVGGAVATAIGERLRTLSESTQILVVTHSPQVAALGQEHLKVSKKVTSDRTLTQVQVLTPLERREEIARMLAGRVVTDEARAAADQLMGAKQAA